MLFARRHEAICVLGVSTDVLDLPGVVITDSNAGSNYVRFATAPQGLSHVDRDQTFAEDWKHTNQIEYWRRKAAKCAEVLVPDRIEPRHLRAFYVSCDVARIQLESLKTDLPVIVDGHLFFV